MKRVNKRSISNEWNYNQGSTSKELKGKVRALIWFMECNMIYIQKNILFENKKHQVIGKLENTLFEKFIEN